CSLMPSSAPPAASRLQWPYRRRVGASMRIPRLTISELMVVVAVVGLDVAAARGLYAYRSVLMAGMIPTGIAVQFGLLRLVRNRDGDRVFWAGFVAAGLAAMLSFVWALYAPNSRSPLWRLWSAYSEFIGRVPHARTIIRGGGTVAPLVAVTL